MICKIIKMKLGFLNYFLLICIYNYKVLSGTLTV